MYNFSGLLFRVWGVCGIIFLLGLFLLLCEKPWSATFTIKNCKFSLMLICVSLILSVFYISRIISPNILSYSGNFVKAQRNSRVAPPLPTTYEYIFNNGSGENQVFYLDVFSKNAWLVNDLIEGQEYMVYYDTFTKIILRIDILS